MFQCWCEELWAEVPHMGDPIGNAFVFMGLLALLFIIIPIFLSVFFGVSVFVLVRRWLRRRSPPGNG